MKKQQIISTVCGAILSLGLLSCQQNHSSYMQELSKYLLKESDQLSFSIYHIALGNKGIKMEVAPGQLDNLINKLNTFKRMEVEASYGHHSHYLDGSRVIYEGEYHAVGLFVYKNGEEMSCLSLPISKEQCIEENGLKIDISSCFTKESWNKIDFNGWEPKVNLIL